MINRRTLAWLLLCATFCRLFTPPAGASDTVNLHPRDARILLRTLQYVRNLQPMDAVPLAIIYDPENPASHREAKDLAQLLKTEDTDQATNSRLVAIHDLERSDQVRVLFLTRHLSAYFERIAQHATERGLLTVSMDRDCAGSAGCVVAFETRAGIEIFINQSNMKRNRIDFDAAFMYTAKRL